MATYVPAKYGTEYIFYVGIESVATAGTFQANATLASGDVKISKDGGTLTNLTTLPTVTPASGKLVKVTLSATEMQCDNATVIFSDSSGGEWRDLIINIQTAARQIDDLAFPSTSGRGIDVTTGGEVGIDWANIGSPTTTVNLSGTTTGLVDGAITAAKIASDAITAAKIADGAIDAGTFATGAINAAAIAADAITDAKVASDVTIAAVTGAVGSVTGNVGGSVGSVTAGVSLADGAITSTKFGAGAITATVIATDAIDADALAADAVTEIQSGLLTTSAFNTKLGTPAGASVSADVATLTAYVDTEVAAIKAKTDNLPASPANEATLFTIAGYLDTEVAAIKTVTDALPNGGALTTITNNVAAILADTGTDGVVLSTAQMQALADIVLGRSVSNIDSTASTHSLYELIQAILESNTSSGSWVIYKTNGSTTFNTRTLATDVDALPIVGVS